MGWLVPELGTQFPDSFSKMLIDYIYNNWSITTGLLAKPPTPVGQSTSMEFKRGFPTELKTISVSVLQRRTETIESLNSNKKWLSMGTAMEVKLRVYAMVQTDPDDVLTDMEQELSRIIGQYPTNDIVGIKNMMYERGERDYIPSDDWDKSEWSSTISILMWYELRDADAV